MGYEVGYATKKKGQLCSRSACVEGGKILKGQLRFTLVAENNGNEFRNWRHLACVGDGQRKNTRRKYTSGKELPGYDTLSPQDKAHINDFFGWDQEQEETGQPNNAAQYYLPSTIASSSVKAETVPDYYAQEPSISPTRDEPPLDDMLGIWDVPIPSNTTVPFENRDQDQLGQVDNGDLSSLYDQLSSLAFSPLKPTAVVRTPDHVKNKYHSNGPLGSGLRRETPTNDLWLMQLELDEKEARVRLANAELEVAKSQTKAEAARQAVIEQRLRMARAGFLRDDARPPAPDTVTSAAPALVSSPAPAAPPPSAVTVKAGRIRVDSEDRTQSGYLCITSKRPNGIVSLDSSNANIFETDSLRRTIRFQGSDKSLVIRGAGADYPLRPRTCMFGYMMKSSMDSKTQWNQTWSIAEDGGITATLLRTDESQYDARFLVFPPLKNRSIYVPADKEAFFGTYGHDWTRVTLHLEPLS